MKRWTIYKAWYTEEFNLSFNKKSPIILIRFKSKSQKYRYYYHINNIFYGNKRLRFTMYRMNWILDNNSLERRGPFVSLISDTIKFGFDFKNSKRIKRGILSKVPHVFKF